MSEVTQNLAKFESDDPSAAEMLLPLVYEELRKLAAVKLSREKPGQTLQATALVHEAYLRLVGNGQKQVSWNGRGHFFAAAAEAMRRILVERARASKRLKRGNGADVSSLVETGIASPQRPDELLEVDEVLDQLGRAYPQAAQLVKLRYFMGMTIPEAAELLGVSPRKANQIWAFSRVWLMDALGHSTDF